VKVNLEKKEKQVNLLSVDYPKAAKEGRPHPIQVDESLKEFTVSVSGSNPTLTIINPGGKQAVSPQVTPLLDLVHVKVVNVKVC
jgi:hypothetical protein